MLTLLLFMPTPASHEKIVLELPILEKEQRKRWAKYGTLFWHQ